MPLCALAIPTLVLVLGTTTAPSSSKLAAWDVQLRGANGFNKRFDEQWFADLEAAGIRFCRLTADKARGTGRDFLLGDADEFRGIPPADLRHLLEIVGWAERHRVRLVIVPLSLPGCRWSQHNDGVFDRRLWTDARYHEEAAAFWKELATALRGRPNVIGYEILNEPAPERALGLGDEWTADLAAHYRKVKGTPADVNRLYATVHRAIRAVDPDTPVVVSASFFGFAGAMPWLRPLEDDKVIYSFHTYEPYALTNFKTNGGRFTYPGDVLTGEQVQRWDRARIARHVAAVAAWAAEQRIPPRRIFVGEFGCDRRVPGAQAYLRDSLGVFNEHGWHWAFYAFREDEWHAFDYEIGDAPLPASYWQAQERGETPTPPRHENPLWAVLREAARGTATTPG